MPPGGSWHCRMPLGVGPVPFLDGTARPGRLATLLFLSSSFVLFSSPSSRFISLFCSSPPFFSLIKIFLSVLTDSTMSCFRSFLRLPLFSVICSSVVRAPSVTYRRQPFFSCLVCVCVCVCVCVHARCFLNYI